MIGLAVRAGAALLVLAVTTCGAHSMPGHVDQLRTSSRQTEVFALADGPALLATKRVFTALLNGEEPSADDLHAAGFETTAAGPFRALVDRHDAPAGRGLFVVRSDGDPLMLSIPHQFKDLKTGELGAQLMEEMPFGAAAFNSAPRDLATNSDVAHADNTHFNAAHLAFASQTPSPRIVQLHGFAREKRRTPEGRLAEIIISSGTERPAPEAVAIRECLRRGGVAARLYGVDVGELGGTKNRNLLALLGAGHRPGTFIHVEISRRMRETLTNNKDARWFFGTCLGAKP